MHLMWARGCIFLVTQRSGNVGVASRHSALFAMFYLVHNEPGSKYIATQAETRGELVGDNSPSLLESKGGGSYVLVAFNLHCVSPANRSRKTPLLHTQVTRGLLLSDALCTHFYLVRGFRSVFHCILWACLGTSECARGGRQ